MSKTKMGAFNPLPVVPIVLVGANVKGRPNYTTVGFVSGVNIRPSIICISLNKKHHTPKGILENGTFSINIPSADYIKETDYCGLIGGKTTDKSKVFTSFYGELETAPMIEEFPITCECKYIGKKVELEMDIVYFGEIRQVYMNEEIATGDRKIDVAKAKPLLLGIDNVYRTPGKSIGKAYLIGWEYESQEVASMSDGASDTHQCRLIDQPAQPALTIRYQGSETNTSKVFGRALFAVLRYARKLGVSPTGYPFVAYHGMTGHNIDMEIGFTFGQRIEGKDTIRSGEIPGGKYASYTHIGPYDRLPTGRALLHHWMLKNDYTDTGVSYEFYLNDPRKTPPGELETQIVIPLG